MTPPPLESGRPNIFWRSDVGRPLSIHLPLKLPDRANLSTAVRRHGGALDDRFAKSDIVVIDTDTAATSAQSRELFRAARALPQPLPCVAASWITDSVRVGIAQNVRNPAYDPVHLLDVLEQKEARKKRAQELHDQRLAALMRKEVARDAGMAKVHSASRLPG